MVLLFFTQERLDDLVPYRKGKLWVLCTTRYEEVLRTGIRFCYSSSWRVQGIGGYESNAITFFYIKIKGSLRSLRVAGWGELSNQIAGDFLDFATVKTKGKSKSIFLQ